MPNPNITVKFKDYTIENLTAFISNIQSSGGYDKTAYFAADEKSHFERYGFFDKTLKSKISLVFDTKAKMLLITAPAEVIQKLEKFIYSTKPAEPQTLTKIDNKAAQVQNNSGILQQQSRTLLPLEQLKPAPVHQKADLPFQKPVSTQNNIKAGINQNNEGSQVFKDKPVIPQPRQNTPVKQEPQIEPLKQEPLKKPEQNKEKQIQTGGNKQTSKNKKQPIPREKNPAADSPVKTKREDARERDQTPSGTNTDGGDITSLEYKNGFTLKKYDSARFEKVLETLMDLKELNIKSEKTVGANTKIDAYEISDLSRSKIYLRFLPQKKTVMLQGKLSDLFKKIQTILCRGAEYKTAVSSYIKQSGEDETLSKIEKKLRKLIPSAYEYLSEQSKKDLTFAFIDINNEETKLSDYSGLLVSPYRGLERLIYDLQTAQGISVKMIGQAYEKQPSGSYCIKSGYMKKIQSIVYNEVMSALYTEYFEKRNFYLHSDNSLLSSQRIIKEKLEAKKIFDNLLEIINYNCAKLKEINFSIN